MLALSPCRLSLTFLTLLARVACAPARMVPQGISSFLWNLYSYGQAECGDWAMWKCVFGHSKFLGCVAILAVRSRFKTVLEMRIYTYIIAKSHYLV